MKLIMSMTKNQHFRLLVLVLTGMLIASCSSDEDENGGVRSGTWYLETWGESEITCDWGEYIRFSGNTMYWNKRNQGTENTTYTVSGTDETFYCTSSSDGSYTFTVYYNTGRTMTTYSTDGIVRTWRR